MFTGGILSLLAQGEYVAFILVVAAIMMSFIIHEWGHAYAAVLEGDQTPRFDGRLTLNPAKHIDPFGFLLILLVGFGWAKPVITNPSRYKHKWGDLFVSSAGIIMNLILALICLILLRIVLSSGVGGEFMQTLVQALTMIAYMNVSLAIFNAIPIPPLDGSHILLNLLPRNMQFQWRQAMYSYNNTFLLLIALMLNYYVLGNPLGKLIYAAFRGLATLVGV
ncbi:site-2 protease family protein [Deinococcus cellulosilyticus]|uniref:Site-2 protease family protein n=1 Tax=Deinococcus cellulosilyticus (strain DSM 18568 / NBRC 106333 / KACC 11606 / 5516J-15) TaxID=1223518 RepID=A0A511MXM8_DEIC1|nr:site-2 protease family protein [Deinococcus cellulosilyticus]GEM45028.1 site-2 protease family protein [Deinococcus cellulosilyticus NBRC 106333 = KACC 11606]